MSNDQSINNCCSVSRAQFTKRAVAEAHPIPVSSSLNQDEGFIFIKGGAYIIGTTSDDPDIIEGDGEDIREEIFVNNFYLSKYPITNAEFIAATNYITDAEKYGWSFVFHLFVTEQQEVLGVANETPWWLAVSGASWRTPEGIGSTIRNRLDHPVVHISWSDAQAYAKWANKRLPTEAEWEYAASGGVINQKFPWGSTLTENDTHHANVWQGTFPHTNTGEDGFIGTAPVHAYDPNTFGLYNLIGNVWEWSADTFTTRSPHFKKDATKKLIKGGSYLCHTSYCNRYRIAARTFNTIDSSTGHMGFRLAFDNR